MLGEHALIDPAQYATGTIVQTALSKNNKKMLVYVNLEDQGEEGEPVLYNEPLIPYLICRAIPREARKDNDDWFAWTLWLSGVVDDGQNPLGYASESDTENIINLVRLLEDKESLYSLATLVNPDAMAEATKKRSILKVLAKYEANLFLDKYSALEEIMHQVFRTKIFRPNSTMVYNEPIVYSLDLTPLYWHGLLPVFSMSGSKRNMVKGLRRILKRSKLNLIKGAEGVNTQNVFLTPLSIEDWNTIVKILGKNPLKEYNLGESIFFDPKLFDKR